MQANFSDFFNSKEEQVNLESVVIYTGPRIGNGDSVPLTLDMRDFEYLIIYSSFTSSGSYFSLEPSIVTPETLLDTAFSDVLITQRYGDTASRVDVKVAPAASTPTSLRVSAGTSSNWIDPGIHKVVGYRRRISQIGLDEILAVVAQPNLFINTWHAGTKVVNQRAFNGNWSALSIGDYGLDMWLKTSSTHKGFIIEAGSYIPNAKYIVQMNGSVVGEVYAPADGGHWLHSFPFASDKFDIRLGSVKVPWHPDTDARLEECLRFYLDLSNKIAVVTGGSPANANKHPLPTRMRKVPNVTQTISSGSGATLTATDITISQDGIHSVDSSVPVLKLDATIALSEVTDDSEHRVVWG